MVSPPTNSLTTRKPLQFLFFAWRFPDASFSLDLPNIDVDSRKLEIMFVKGFRAVELEFFRRLVILIDKFERIVSQFFCRFQFIFKLRLILTFDIMVVDNF